MSRILLGTPVLFGVGETGMIIFVLMGEKAAALENHEPWLNVTNITRFVTFLKNKILSIELDYVFITTSSSIATHPKFVLTVG